MVNPLSLHSLNYYDSSHVRLSFHWNIFTSIIHQTRWWCFNEINAYEGMIHNDNGRNLKKKKKFIYSTSLGETDFKYFLPEELDITHNSWKHRENNFQNMIPRVKCFLLKVPSKYLIVWNEHFQTPRIYEGWESSHGNYFIFLARLTDNEEKWKYTSGSGWC